MPVLHYISILVLTATLVFQSSFVTVSALMETEVAIHSIDELQIFSEIHDESQINTTRKIQEQDIQEDISNLLLEKSEYIENENLQKMEKVFITNPITETSIFTTELSIFESFVRLQETTFVTGEKNKRIQLNRPAKKEKKVIGTHGTIAVNMTTGTNISSPSGVVIDPALIEISSVSESVQAQANEYYSKKIRKEKKIRKNKKIIEDPVISTEVFEFGIPGTHLIFSSPVTLSIATPLYSDGIMVDLAVLHEGNREFNTSGLSTSPDTLCNSDGSASKPGSQGVVKDGKVTFYTCGASRFTMNPSGGTTGSNDLRIVIGDCAQTQIYYNNLTQVYTGTPPANGCSTNSNMDSWPVLRIGTVSYGNDFTAWSTRTTTGTTVGNTYAATSTMTRVVGGLTYTLIIDWSHTAPNKYLTWSYRVVIPTGNTLPIKFYYGMDSFVAGADTNDVGYYTNTGGQTVGIFDSVANIVSAFRYIDGPVWTGYQANGYNTVRTQIVNGANFTNAIQTTGGDLGFGINWDFGTTPATYTGSVEWRLLPYVAANVPDLIPGIAQPEGPLTTGYLSQLPIILTNAGNLTSSGIHTVVLTLPTTISGPVSSFSDNDWSCGAQVGTTVTCTKTTSIASLESDTVRIPVIPLPAAGGTSVTFNVSISNPSDSNTTNNTAFANNAVVASSLTYAPGGVTGMTFWVKADGNKNCSTTGCTITSWTNSGTLGAAANAITGLGTVTYDPTTLINYNPTLYFNNASLNSNSNLSITTAAASIFTMSKIGNGGSFRIGPQTAINNSLDWSTSTTTDIFARYAGTVIYNGANGRWVGTPSITSTSRATGGSATNQTDGLQTLTNTLVTTTFVGANIGIGRSVAANSTLANIGEVIIYPSEIIGANRNKVESYLAIKYGITLNQTISQNYTLSDNSIAWDSSVAGIFGNNIAGIVRDDISSLNQVKSQSINNPGDIIVNAVSPISINYGSLIWGNDGSATGSFVTTDAPFGYERITREWQFQEKNGNIGNIKVAYPESSLPIGATSPIYMLVDSDGTFATGSTVYTGTLNSGNWEFIVNLNDMDHITIAKAGDTIPPTIISISRASGSLMPIGNFPITITYNDTGSVINTATFTGKIYSWDGVSAWNTVNLAPTYMSIAGVPSTSTGTFNITNLPFGKYRFDISIEDAVGNITTQSYTYYVDAIEWNISSDQYDIGTIIPNNQTIGSGTMTIVVKTVGAPFNVKMTGIDTLSKGSDTINYWNGIKGWGYDSGGGILANHASSMDLANQGANININGLKNTYTYSLKFGTKIDSEIAAGLYDGSIKMDIIINY